MIQLQTVAARSPKQLLKRLYSHYTGEPLPDGIPLRAVADGMLKLDRTCRILFLTEQHSLIVHHVIVVDADGKRKVDVNTFIRVKWEYPRYEAMLLGGRVVQLGVRKEMTIEEFIERSALHHTFARRVNLDQVSKLPEEEDVSQV